ncbi:MAG: hypothetical protein ACYCOU_14780, partial [Sulfobacillus sp.]
QRARSIEAAETISLEYIGIVKAYAMLASRRLVIQGSNIKTWASDDKLARVGIEPRNKYLARHQMDAQRHILYYLCHNAFVDRELQQSTLRQLKKSEPGS